MLRAAHGCEQSSLLLLNWSMRSMRGLWQKEQLLEKETEAMRVRTQIERRVGLAEDEDWSTLLDELEQDLKLVEGQTVVRRDAGCDEEA